MLTSLPKVRDRLQIPPAELKWDAMLTHQIHAALGRFNAEANRVFERGAGVVEEFDAGMAHISLQRYPIEEITKWELLSDGAWVEQPGVRAIPGRGGTVTLHVPVGIIGQTARVTYTGGYVLPDPLGSPGMYPLPEVLEVAAIETVAHWFQMKDYINMYRVEMPTSGEFREIGDRYWVPWVRALLRKFRKVVL